MFPLFTRKISPSIAEKIDPLRSAFREKIITLSLTISGSTFAFLNLTSVKLTSCQHSILKLSWFLLGLAILFALFTQLFLIRVKLFSYLMEALLPSDKLDDLKENDKATFNNYWDKLFFWLTGSFWSEGLSLMAFVLGVIFSFYFIIIF